MSQLKQKWTQKLDGESGGGKKHEICEQRPLEGIFLGHIVSGSWPSLDPLLRRNTEQKYYRLATSQFASSTEF